MKFIKLFLFTLLVSLSAFSQDTKNLKVYFDDEHWTEYIEGNIPLVISVPHGGATVLADVPVRSCKGATTVTDSKTIELAQEIQKSFEERYKLRPHIIICHLSRKHVDQNREIIEGTCGNAIMEKPWKQFHHYIDSALALATNQYSKAVYIDLHGHGHSNQRLELGYLLKSDDLNNVPAADNNSDLAKKSSINNLLIAQPSSKFGDLLIGDQAFGTLIATNGFPAVPSKQDKAPLAAEKYFNGGYNTKYYTSEKYPNVFGFQIECNFKGVRDAAGRPLFAEAFSKSVMDYFKKNTDIVLKGKK